MNKQYSLQYTYQFLYILQKAFPKNNFIPSYLPLIHPHYTIQSGRESQLFKAFEGIYTNKFALWIRIRPCELVSMIISCFYTLFKAFYPHLYFISTSYFTYPSPFRSHPNISIDYLLHIISIGFVCQRQRIDRTSVRLYLLIHPMNNESFLPFSRLSVLSPNSFPPTPSPWAPRRANRYQLF